MKYTSLSLTRYLTKLSSSKPVPGGGSVSAYVASLGMGLAEMAAQIGMKKADSGAKTEIQKAVRLLRKAKRDALQVVDLDPKVYGAVMKAYAKARTIEDPLRKNRLIDEALENSFRLQADLALLASMAKRAAESLLNHIKGSIRNDLKVSLAILNAAFQGACDTARINVVYLKDSERKRRSEQALEELKKQYEPTHASGN